MLGSCFRGTDLQVRRGYEKMLILEQATINASHTIIVAYYQQGRLVSRAVIFGNSSGTLALFY